MDNHDQLNINLNLINDKLCRAVQNHDIEEIDLLISLGADINQANINGKPIFLSAVHYSHFNVVQHLLECGADVNAKDQYDNESAIFDVVNYESILAIKYAKLFMHHGVDLFIKNKSGKTVMDRAKEKHHNDLVDLFNAHIEQNTLASQLEDDNQNDMAFNF